MKKSARQPAKKTAKPRRSVETAGLIQIHGPIGLRLDLSSAGVRGACAAFQRALAAGGWRVGGAQLRLDSRDLNAIYLYLNAPQVEKLVARLKALALSERRTR